MPPYAYTVNGFALSYFYLSINNATEPKAFLAEGQKSHAPGESNEGGIRHLKTCPMAYHEITISMFLPQMKLKIVCLCPDEKSSHEGQRGLTPKQDYF